ncbi:hypothetical protein Pelo_6784 [Pelomyxa schiedti]|nr:hypothetical protein Pelo_6784 [Pelomyxa schiedti]
MVRDLLCHRRLNICLWVSVFHGNQPLKIHWTGLLIVTVPFEGMEMRIGRICVVFVLIAFGCQLASAQSGGALAFLQDPLQDIRRLYTDVQRIFESAIKDPTKTLFQSHTYECETDKEYVFEFDLPGVGREDVTLSLQCGEITISGNKQIKVRQPPKLTTTKSDEKQATTTDEEPPKPVNSEWITQTVEFTRQVSVPVGTTADDIHAILGDGLLKVTVSKSTKPSPPVIIPIQAP